VKDSRGSEKNYRYTIKASDVVNIEDEGLEQRINELIDSHYDEIQKFEEALVKFLAKIKAMCEVRGFDFITEQSGDC
jgi:hypothetical protein